MNIAVCVALLLSLACVLGAKSSSSLDVSDRKLQDSATTTTTTTNKDDDDDDDDHDDDHDHDHDDDDDDDDGNRENRPSKREFEINVNDNKVEIRQSSETSNDQKDKLDFELNLEDDGLEVEVKYKWENKSKLAKVKRVEERYEVVFHSIVEYVPDATEGVQGFDFENSVRVQTVKASSWAKMAPKTEACQVAACEFNAITQDGVLAFKMKLSMEDDAVKKLSPNQIKIDVAITDFPWKLDDTALALLTTIKTKSKIKSLDTVDSEHNENGKYPRRIEVSFDIKDATLPFGKFTWVEDAVADGQTIRVVATAAAQNDEKEEDTDDDDDDDDEEEKKKIAFAFVGASKGTSNILWDPVVGVTYPAGSPSGPSAATDTALSVLVLTLAALCNI